MTKDALPFGRTIGSRPARVRSELNRVIASRLTVDTIGQLKLAYRYLLQSKLNTTQALAQIEQDESLSAAEIRYRWSSSARRSAGSSCEDRRDGRRNWSPMNRAVPEL